MAFRYCFEQDKVKRTLAKSKKNNLAVIDTEGNESAVNRGVYVYGYLNAGALESECSQSRSARNYCQLNGRL